MSVRIETVRKYNIPAISCTFVIQSSRKCSHINYWVNQCKCGLSFTA